MHSNSNRITLDFDISNFKYEKKNGKKIILGKGSFATVYLAKHKLSKRQYAIKKINLC